jgi:hypothetical protein
MAAPDYVPKPTDEIQPRVYVSPPWRPDSWMADRPSEVDGLQPTGPGLGSPGPDQGYALHLARRFEDKLVLTPGEHKDDALAGCVAIAMRRSSLFGRAPVIHDLTVALTLWGFLAEVSSELSAARKDQFAAVASTHHYEQRQTLVDRVPEDVLRMTHGQVAEAVKADPEWVLSFSDAPAH